MKRKNCDYKTIAEAFRATRYPYSKKWNPDILGVYKVLPNSDYRSDSVYPDQVYSESQNQRYPDSILLYYGVQLNGIEYFLRNGFSEGNKNSKIRSGKVILNNTSFGAVNYFNAGEPPFTCRCVRYVNDVIYVVVCEVPGLDKLMTFDREPPSRGLYPFEKYKGEFSLDDNCYYRDSLGRGLSRGVFPCKLVRPIKSKGGWDNFLVGVQLVKPVYLVAARFHFKR